MMMPDSRIANLALDEPKSSSSDAPSAFSKK
jgi:hypothetical protein